MIHPRIPPQGPTLGSYLRVLGPGSHLWVLGPTFPVCQLFLKIPQYSQGNFLACNFIKKTLQQKCFHVNIAKFLRILILKNICERLPMKNDKIFMLLIKVTNKMVTSVKRRFSSLGRQTVHKRTKFWLLKKLGNLDMTMYFFHPSHIIIRKFHANVNREM